MQDLLSLLAWGDTGWGDELARGAGLTLLLAVCTMPIGAAAGLAIAVARNGNTWWLSAIGNLYTTVFRSLPELLTILVVYYGGQILLRQVSAALGFGADVEVNGFVAGLLALGTVLAAFSSEVWLGALKAVPKGQREGAAALGVSRWHAFRLVVFPQLLRIALPGLGNNWMALLKDTSLVSVIAFTDLMRMTNIAVGVTKRAFFFYCICCLLYLAMAIASSFVIIWLERRSSRGLVRGRA